MLWRVNLRKLIDEVLGYVRKVSGVKVPPYPKIGDLISLISPQGGAGLLDVLLTNPNMPPIMRQTISFLFASDHSNPTTSYPRDPL